MGFMSAEAAKPLESLNALSSKHPESPEDQALNYLDPATLSFSGIPILISLCKSYRVGYLMPPVNPKPVHPFSTTPHHRTPGVVTLLACRLSAYIWV